MCARLKSHIIFLCRTNFKLAIHLLWWEWWMERWMCEGCWQDMHSFYEVFGRCWGHEISVWRYFINFMNSIKWTPICETYLAWNCIKLNFPEIDHSEGAIGSACGDNKVRNEIKYIFHVSQLFILNSQEPCGFGLFCTWGQCSKSRQLHYNNYMNNIYIIIKIISSYTKL